MTELEVHLLGPPFVSLNGETLADLRSDKAQALLSYLAVESDHPHRREKLAGLLWPEYPESSARTNLRRALADLRKSINDDDANPPYLQITRHTIQFNADSQAWVDVSEFISRSRNHQPATEQVIQDWSTAADLYQGEFMEGFALPESSAYDEWLLLTRQHLQRVFLETLHNLVEGLMGRGEIERGLPYAWRHLEIDHVRESSHRQLMRLLALNGQRSAALEQYETCSQVLMRELGVEPSPETRQVYEQILQGVLAPAVGEVEIQARKPRKIGSNPYLGLSSFQEADAPFFFGREDFTEQLRTIVNHQQGLTMLLGPSGSGKSSVVNAGLLPDLGNRDNWLIASTRPGRRPFNSMAMAALPTLGSDLSETDLLIEAQKLSQAFTEFDLSIKQLLDRVLEKNSQADHLLIIIDQFEELYTLCPDKELRHNFLDHLVDAARKGAEKYKASYSFLLIMRADFMGQALTYRPFADTLQNATLMLGPMKRDEMRIAIEKPAEIQGGAFEEGLVERLLDDIGAEPGNLPLLEFALTLLWEKAENGWLTHRGYKEIGQVHGALSRYADQVYDELEEPDKRSARQIFLQLVRPGEGTEDTRCQASRAEIGERNWKLVQHLADKRLVVTGQDSDGSETVELVHAVLIYHWDYLRGWIESDHGFRIWQENLREARRKWEHSDRDNSALLQGLPLEEARAWSQERLAEIRDQELEFIQASIGLQEQKISERNRLRRRIVLGLSVGLVLTIFLAIIAGLQWRQADLQRQAAQQAQATAAAERDQTQSALSGLLAAQSDIFLDEQYDLSLLLGVESLRRVETLEGQGSLFTALEYQPRLSFYLHGHQDDIQSLAFHPNGRLLASGDRDGKIYLWDINKYQPIGDPLNQHQGQISGLAFNSNGSVMASSSFDGTIILWDFDEASPTFGQVLTPQLVGHSGNIWSVAFSPDGEILASGAAEGEVILWDANQNSDTFGKTMKTLPILHKGFVTSLAFSPEGNILASGGADGSIILWDAATGSPITPPLTGHARFVSSVAFSPDGQILASGSKDNTIILWDTAQSSNEFGKALIEPLAEHNDTIWDLAFNKNEKLLASSSEDGTVLLWDLDRTSETFGQPRGAPLAGHNGAVYALAYNPNDNTLATGGSDHKVAVWNPAESHSLQQLYTITPEERSELDVYFKLAFSPDGEKMVLASWGGPLYLLETSKFKSAGNITPDVVMQAHTNHVKALAFSPDGKILASGDDEDMIILWDMDDTSTSFGQPIGQPVRVHIDYIQNLEFTPDGKTIVSGDVNGMIRLWDVDTTNVSDSIFIEERLNGVRSALSPGGNILVVSNLNGRLRFWEVDPGSKAFGQQLGSLQARHEGPVLDFQFNSSGNILASAGEDGSIRLWDVEPESGTFGQQLRASLIDKPVKIYSLEFSPDGKYLVSGDVLGRVNLFELSSRKTYEIPGLEAFTDPAQDVSFSPDGKMLVILFRDARLALIDFDLDAWQTKACERANRNLTQDEWEHFFGDEPYRPTCPGLQVIEPDIGG